MGFGAQSIARPRSAPYGETLRVPMWDRIRAVAKPIGIDFAFEKITRGPASLDGQSVAAARAHLESELDLEAPFRETEAWRAQGVTSMPHYILRFSDGHEEVVRETSVEVFADAFRRAKALRVNVAQAVRS